MFIYAIINQMNKHTINTYLCERILTRITFSQTHTYTRTDTNPLMLKE